MLPKARRSFFPPTIWIRRSSYVTDWQFLKQGQLIYTGSVEQLLAQHPQQSLEAIYLQMAGRLTDDHLVDALEGEHDA